MRKFAVGLAILVALVIVALLVVPHFIDVNRYHNKIQAELEKRLNRPVTLGNMHLGLFPPAFRVDNVNVGENPAFGHGSFATAQELYVTAKLWPLVHGDVQISSLDLRNPKIELIRNPQGVWNFQTIGQNNNPAQNPNLAQQPSSQPQQRQHQQAQQQQQQQQAKQQGGGQQFELDNLKITNGEVAVTDQQKKQPRTVYDHIDASVKNYAPEKPFSFSVAAHLPGKGTQTVALSGNAGPINNSNMIQTPFSGTLKLNDVALSGLRAYMGSSNVSNMEGTVSGTTDINNENGKLSSRGNLTIRDGRVNGVTIGYPVSADYRINDDLANDVINIDKANIKLGATPVAISGNINSKPTPAQLDVRLQAANVDIADAARLASAFGVAFNPGMKVAGRATADVHAQGPANKPAMNGNVSASDLIVSGSDLPQPVKIQAISLALTPQDIRSNPFQAISGGTSVNGQFTLAQYTSPSPNIDATLRTANANITELISMARAYGVTAIDGMNGSGTLDLDVHAAGPLKNTNAMTFNGTGAIRNASIKPAQLTKPLNVRDADIRFNSNSATLNNLAAAIGSSTFTGNMNVKNFSAPNLQFTLAADKIDVNELQQLTAGTPQQKASLDIVPRADAQATAKPAPSLLALMTGTGNISANQLHYDQLVINNLKSGVNIGRGIVNLTPITGELYGGQETGQITANLLTTPMLVNAQTKLQNVRANDLLSAVSSVKNTLYGLLAANGDVRFSAGSGPGENIARSLNGNLALNLNNGRIAKIDILNELAAIGKFAGVRKNAQAMTNFAKMGGNFVVTNGVAETNNFQAAIDGGTLAGAGTIDLASQALNLSVTAILDKNVTQQVGGTGIGGFMQTALANNRGELVMPVLITGTFDQPHFAPDMQKIAEMKMRNLLPTTNNPAGAAAGILGAIGGNKGQGGQPAQGGALGGILGAIGGNQQQGNQQQQPPATAQPQQQPQQQQTQQEQQQQQPNNPVNDILNSVLGGKKKQ